MLDLKVLCKRIINVVINSRRLCVSADVCVQVKVAGVIFIRTYNGGLPYPRAGRYALYLRRGKGSKEARRFYRERFPQRKLPSHVFFQRFHIRLLQTADAKLEEIATVRTVPFDENVLAAIRDCPQVLWVLNGSHVTLCNVLCDERMHIFKLQKIHALLPEDFPRRIMFCLISDKVSPSRIFKAIFCGLTM